MRKILLSIKLAFMALTAYSNPDYMGDAPDAVSNQVINYPFLSALDVWKTNVDPTLIRRYGDQGSSLFLAYDRMGMVIAKDAIVFSHFEENWILETFHAASTVTAPTNPGDPIIIALDAADIDANGKYWPRLQDDVMFPNQKTGKIKAITPSGGTYNITIYPHKQTDTLSVASGSEIIVYSDGVKEGSTGVAARTSKVSKFTFGMKILRDKMEVTGTAMANKEWFDIMSDGQKISGYWVKGSLDLEYRMMQMIDGAALFDVPITNTTLVSDGDRNMTGLVPYYRANGNTHQYQPGLVNLSDFYIMTNQLVREFAPREYFGRLGQLLFNDTERLLQNYVTNLPDATVSYTGSGPQRVQDLAINFKTVNVSGFTFHLERMGILSHPKLYGAPGFNLEGLGIWIPNGAKKLKENGGAIPYMSFVYLEKDGYSRKMRTWAQGGGNDMVNNTDYDGYILHKLSECGGRIMAANTGYIWDQA